MAVAMCTEARLVSSNRQKGYMLGLSDENASCKKTSCNIAHPATWNKPNEAI
jgi:hypothetical protein